MIKALRKKLNQSSAARWTVLFFVSFTMLTGYILSDVMAPLKTMLEQQLNWNSSDYGTFTSGYGIFNIFLFMLIISGMLLDRKGPRFTGLLAVFIMLAGTFIKYWAISAPPTGEMTSLNIFGWNVFTVKTQVLYAMLGFAIVGVGIEMIGITANKMVVKWFRGRSLALALGLNVAAGRIGTALAIMGAYPYAKMTGNVASPLIICMIMLVIGLLTFIVVCAMDKAYDIQEAEEAESEAAKGVAIKKEEQFQPSDILKIARIRAFWYITILCLLFYSAVFPFLKFATELMIQKFHVPTSFAGAIPALLPFGNILLTPLFGLIYDRKGKGATIMMIGSLLLVFVHFMFSLPMLTASWIAVVLMLLLGAAFSLVPSAMWPSVPKIIPYNKLGTAYSMIFWIQNWGLTFVPVIIGTVLTKWGVVGEIVIDGIPSTAYDYTLPMLIFTGFGLLSLLFSWLLKKEDARKHYGLQEPNITKK